MKVFIITPFPEVIHSFMRNSMIKKAQECNLVDYKVLNLFDYADKPHRNIDDYPFGGGNGMVMKPEPIFRAFDEIENKIGPKIKNVIYPTPDGKVFNQNEAKKFKKSETLVFICGHYKGIDHRVREHIVTKEISIGNYVVSGGELPAAVLCDSIIRLLPGIIGDESSALSDTFQDNLLAAPIYTRPEVYKGYEVPKVLLSGNQSEIQKWNDEKSLERTKLLRPNLFDNE